MTKVLSMVIIAMVGVSIGPFSASLAVQFPNENLSGIYKDGVLISSKKSTTISAKQRAEVVKSFPSYAPNWTLGLAFDGEFLWYDDIGDPPWFAKVDTSDGSLIATYTPSAGNRDMAWDGNWLWVTDWGTNCIYKYDNLDCSIVYSFSAPFSGHPNGITWDGEYLWIGQEGDDIWQVDTLGNPVRSIPGPCTWGNYNPRGLAWDGEYLWVGCQDEGVIYKIDPADGTVLLSFASPNGGSQQGLTFDGRYLWSCGSSDGWIYQIYIVVGGGAIEGTVTDAATGNPIDGAIVTASNPHGYTYCDTTNATGHYFIQEILLDNYDMTVSAFGYNDFDTTGIVVVEGEIAIVDFAMLHPEIVVEPDSFYVTVDPGATLDTTMYITNDGNGSLDFEIIYTLGSNFLKGDDSKCADKIPAGKNNIELEPMMGTMDDHASAIGDRVPKVAPWSSAKDPGDILWWYDIENLTGDNQCMGVEFDGAYYYVTGGNTGYDSNKLHFLDINGNYITSIDQVSSPGWGWRDIAYDGNHMYSSDDSLVTEWYVTGLPDDPVLNVVGTFPGPEGLNRALAYDPATDHFWTANLYSPIYEFDRSGTVINIFPNFYPIYGMAWDNVFPDGPWIWMYTQDRYNIRQFDPINGVYTGVTYVGYGSGEEAVAGGACFALQNGLAVFIGLTQGSPNIPDIIFGLEICPTWLIVDPASGTVLPGETFAVTLHFDAAQAVSSSTSILIHNNSIDSLVTIPVTIHVTSVGVEDAPPQIPKVFALNQNYPNPFSTSGGKGVNLQTTISYTLPKSCKVCLRIYNIKGQLVETLVDDVQEPGYHSVVWNVPDKWGISPGIYLYRITAGGFTDTKKCVILK